MATLAYMHFIKYKREELVLDDFAFNLDESKIFSINKRDELLIKKKVIVQQLLIQKE